MGVEGDAVMRRIVGAAAWVIAAVILNASPALAAGIVDQQQTDTGGYDGASPTWGPDYYEIQTFTAGMSKPLIAVEVYAGAFVASGATGSAPNGQVMLEVLPMDTSTAPFFGFVYAREFKNLPFYPPSQPAWVTYTLSTPVDLTAGTEYAILLQAMAPNSLDWLGSCVTNYAGGEAEAMNSFDPFSLKPVNGYHSGTEYCTLDLAFKTVMGNAATPSPSHTPTPAPTATHTPAPAPTHTPTPTHTTGPGVLPPPPLPPTVTASPTIQATPPETSGATPTSSPSATIVAAASATAASATSAPTSQVAGITSVPSAARSPLPAPTPSGPDSTPIAAAAALIVVASLAGAGFWVWRLRLKP